MPQADASTDEAGGTVRSRNRIIHILSLTGSKLSDGLIDPKLVLSWLMGAVGAPQALIGLLVPVREAGALLPQVFTAPHIRAMARRKFAWSGGAIMQGIAALAIAFVAVLFTGSVAGWAIIICLAVLALARSICSVSYKDVLGKTVPKSRRGGTTGLAGSIAAGGVLAFSAILLWSGASKPLVIGAITLAGILWIAAGANFLRLKEDPGGADGDDDTFAIIRQNLHVLRDHTQLRRFILTRGLLISTALAPPFITALGDEGARGLGALVLGSAAAGLVSSAVWGRLSDRSSRKVLMLAGIASAIVLTVAVLLGAGQGPLVLGGLIFAAMIAYQGVRLGRSTHLVDMAKEDERAVFTALSNTVLGILLLLGGLYGVLAAFAGAQVVLGVMAVQSLLGALVAFGLEEVQTARPS